MAISAAFVAMPAAAQPYIGVGVGSAKTDTSNTAGKVFAGYQFTENFAAQLAYNDMGKYGGASMTAWSVAVVGILPVDKNWDVFAKLGASENRTTLPGAGRHSDRLLGVGVGYNINQNLAIRMEYEDFGNLPVNAAGRNWKATNVGFNIKYAF